MAPSQSQIVTFAAGSALLVGVIFTIYLIRSRKDKRPDSASSSSEKNSDPQDTNEEQTEPAVKPKVLKLSSNAQSESLQGQRSESFVAPSDDEIGDSPLPDKEGLTVSASWAILHTSNQSSPHLSPVNSEASIFDGAGDGNCISINGVDDDSMNAAGDDTQTNTVLEEPGDQSTVLEEKVPILRQLSTTEHEVSHVENITLEYEELLREHSESESHTFTREEITEALLATQSPERGLTERNAEVLAGLLSFKDLHLKHTAVQGIANCAAFTNNQNVLRAKGVIPRLTKLLELQRMSLWLRHDNAASAISTTIQAVTNMAINPDNNLQMKGCVQTLVDVSMDKDTGTPIRLSSLQALTNLSAVEDHHTHYTRIVQELYDYLGVENLPLKMQALKILVNLSCNADMVPHLLAAKAPENLPQFLDASSTDEGILLRFVTLLANILLVVRERNLKSSALPSVDKAASPETMYSALFGISSVGNLKNKVFLLCKHSNTEIMQQAAKVYNHLK